MDGWVVEVPSASRHIKLRYLIWAGWASERVEEWFRAAEVRWTSKQQSKKQHRNVKKNGSNSFRLLHFDLFLFADRARCHKQIAPRRKIGGGLGPFADRRTNQ